MARDRSRGQGGVAQRPLSTSAINVSPRARPLADRLSPRLRPRIRERIGPKAEREHVFPDALPRKAAARSRERVANAEVALAARTPGSCVVPGGGASCLRASPRARCECARATPAEVSRVRGRESGFSPLLGALSGVIAHAARLLGHRDDSRGRGFAPTRSTRTPRVVSSREPRLEKPDPPDAASRALLSLFGDGLSTAMGGEMRQDGLVTRLNRKREVVP